MDALVNYLTSRYEQEKKPEFEDDHFRIDDDGFDGDYAELYKQLLFSKLTYNEYMKKEDFIVVKELLEFIQKGVTSEMFTKIARRLLNDIIDTVAKQEELYPSFLLDKLIKYGFFGEKPKT